MSTAGTNCLIGIQYHLLEFSVIDEWDSGVEDVCKTYLNSRIELQSKQVTIATR